ncbi:CAF17-like 4Fe-4S cluster assembly/insertion protein YgfZ [Alsobacter sp. R-9]
MPCAALADRGVVRVTGEDARGFLDGLVTSSLEPVRPGTARYAALLTPQGKILFDFLVTEVPEDAGGGFALDVARGLAPDLTRRLGFYKLRAKVAVEDLSDDWTVAAGWSEGEPAGTDGFVFADPRHPDLGWRAVVPRDEALRLASAPADAWHAHRIGLGVPEGGLDFAYGETFPHEADMDQLGGVDFDKGCFVGQEVVSRMEHRGTARTRIVPVDFVDGFSAPGGADAVAGDRSLGRIGSSAPGGHALAMLRLDRLEDALAAGVTPTAGGLAFVARKPGFARFPFPGDAAKPVG